MVKYNVLFYIFHLDVMRPCFQGEPINEPDIVQYAENGKSDNSHKNSFSVKDFAFI